MEYSQFDNIEKLLLEDPHILNIVHAETWKLSDVDISIFKKNKDIKMMIGEIFWFFYFLPL